MLRNYSHYSDMDILNIVVEGIIKIPSKIHYLHQIHPFNLSLIKTMFIYNLEFVSSE